MNIYGVIDAWQQIKKANFLFFFNFVLYIAPPPVMYYFQFFENGKGIVRIPVLAKVVVLLKSCN